MSEASGPALARARLSEILTQYGRTVIDDPRRFEALLRDLLGEQRREINLLVSSLKERIPNDLLASNNGVPQSLLLDQLTQRLHDHLGIAPHFAAWTVETWAIALGVMAPPVPKRAARTKKAPGETEARSTPKAAKTSPPKTTKTTQPATPPKTTPTAKAGRPTKAATAKAAAQSATAKGTTRTKAATPSPTTQPPPAPRSQLVVSASGKASYRTLGEALKNIADTGTILVQPGTYRESLTLDRPVEIIGNGRAGEILIESLTLPCIHSNATQATLRNLTLTRRGALDKGEAVLVTGGQLTLHDCRVTAQGRGCIVVQGAGASLVAQRCQVSDGSHTGVIFEDRATGQLEACDIHYHRYNGVHITGGANPTLSRVRIALCEIGVLVNDTRLAGQDYGIQGLGILNDCDIVDNHYQGVLISHGAPTLHHCRVQRNLDGIWVERQGAGSVTDCDLSGNRRGAWNVKSGTVRHRGNRE